MNINVSYTRPNKGKFLEQDYSKQLKVKNKLTVKNLEDATILPRKWIKIKNKLYETGGVLDKNHNFCKEAKQGTMITEHWGSFNSQYKNEEVIFLGYYSDNWGHFLLDMFPRFWYVLKKKTIRNKIVVAYKNDENTVIHENCNFLFKLLNIDDKIQIINKPATYKKVTIPEMSFVNRQYYSQEFVDLVNYIIAKSGTDIFESSKNIFISRFKFENNLHEFGLSMLENFYKKNDFQIIYPEQMPLKNLISCFKSANEIVTMSGSAAHNVIFAPSQCCVTYIERIAKTNDYQKSIDEIKNFNVTYIDANIHFYPIHPQDGPVIIYFNKWMKKYADDNSLEYPNSAFISKSYRKKLLKAYLSSYNAMFPSGWRWTEAQVEEIENLYEAYKDSVDEFKDVFKSRFNARLFL